MQSVSFTRNVFVIVCQSPQDLQELGRVFHGDVITYPSITGNVTLDCGAQAFELERRL